MNVSSWSVARLLRKATCILLGVAALVLPWNTTDAAQDRPPNIILILADDLRSDVFGFAGHPVLKTPGIDRLAGNGVIFENAFAVTPLCSPSRATILTGSYPHLHGVTSNGNGLAAAKLDESFPLLLQGAGYHTAFIGKWHLAGSSTPASMFDHFVYFRGQGQYFDPVLTVDGKRSPREGFSTDILTDEAIAWLEKRDENPFMLYLSFKSTHAPYTPPARHAGMFDETPVKLPASHVDSPEELPAAIRGRHPKRTSGRTVEELEALTRGYWSMIPSLDDNVGRLLDALEETGLFERTVIVFTSDHGYALGEHGIEGKGRGYDASMRVPLLVRDPRSRLDGSRVSVDALNVDLAPTFLDLAGLEIPKRMQGRSLVPLLDNSEAAFRKSWLYVSAHAPGEQPDSVGVRTKRFKYLLYTRGQIEEQLFDLQTDPDERKNLADIEAHAADLRKLRRELKRLLKQTGAPAEWNQAQPVTE